uniref:Uncharacterized protein n=1 Tax=Latimeria chalumnae TaxID=7897 RepID=H3A3C5_LATCH
FEDLLNDMITEEQLLKERIEKSIQTCQEELKALCHELSLEPETFEDLTVLQLEKKLRLKVDMLTKEKNERFQELKQLQKQDEELCTWLCSTPYYIPTGCVPSRQQLEELKEHIKSLQEEKEQRAAVFIGYKEKINQYMKEIGHSPDNTFECDVVYEDEDAFLLTTENIKALKVLLKQVKLQLQMHVVKLDTKKHIAMLTVQRLVCNQRRLKAVRSPRIEVIIDDARWGVWGYFFFFFFSPLQSKTIYVCATIFKALTTLLKQLLKEVENLRDLDIGCCFKPNTSECLSLKFSKVKHFFFFYKENDTLASSLLEFKISFALFQKKTSNPNRFVNRGGSLLREEKERTRVQRLLPKLEEELKTSIQKWEAEQGGIFLVKGKRFMDCMTDQWDQYRIQKERVKYGKIMNKDSEGIRTPTKRPYGGPSTMVTPNKTRKKTTPS